MEKTRKRRVVLTQAQREEVVQMYKDGTNQYELADMFDVSQWTISNIVRQSGYDRTHVGSAISRRIKTLEEHPTPTTQSGVSQHEIALVVTQRIVVLDGLGTHWKYLVDSQATVVQIDNALAERFPFNAHVEVVSDPDNNSRLIGLRGRVVRISDSTLAVGVDFWENAPVDDLRTHELNGYLDSTRSGYWCHADSLRVIEY